MASNGPMAIAVNTRLAPSVDAYSSSSSVLANSNRFPHFSRTDILHKVYVANKERVIAIIRMAFLCQKVPAIITNAGTKKDKYHHKLYLAAINSSIELPKT